MRPSAQADLAWYFGSGPESYEGDCGLRSSLGAQIEMMQSSVTEDGVRVPLPGRSVDASASEDQMIQRLHVASRAATIEARLAQLAPRVVTVLQVHFGGGSLPYGIDVAAVLAPSSRQLILATLRSEARTAITILRSLQKANVEAWPTIMAQVHSPARSPRWDRPRSRKRHVQYHDVLQAVRLAHRALSVARADSHQWSRRPIPVEVLRTALLDGDERARHRIRSEADAMVTEAVRLYEEETHVERRRLVPIHDPRRSRWTH